MVVEREKRWEKRKGEREREGKTREEEFLRADRRVFGARSVWVWPLGRVGRVCILGYAYGGSNVIIAN